MTSETRPLSKQISQHVSGLPDGQPIAAKDLLHLGSREVVDQTLSRLVKRGALLRIDRGLYQRPNKNINTQNAATVRYLEIGRLSRKMLDERAQALFDGEPRLKKLIKLARERLKARQVWIFGSRARGDFQNDSDWDIFIIVPDETPDYDFNPMVTWEIGHDAGLTADVVAEHESDVKAAVDTINTLAYRLPREGIRIF